MKGYSKVLLLLISKANLRMVNWVLVRQEFCGFNLNDILLNWEAVSWFMGAGRKEAWIFLFYFFVTNRPPVGFLKFNVNGAASGKLHPSGIGGVL